MAINIDVLIKLGILLFFAGCSQPSLSPPDQLIYVEGIELTAGRFGDLVMMGPEIKGKQVLTRDSFYDAWPFFKNTDEIIFLSARRQGDKRLGLSKEDDLYIYNNEVVEPLFNWVEDGIMYMFNFDRLTQTVLYKKVGMGTDGAISQIIQQNIADSSDQKIIYDRAWEVHNAKISPKRQFMLLEKWFFLNGSYAGHLYLYNLEQYTEREILNGITDPEIGQLTEKFCTIGSFISDTEFLFACTSHSDKNSIIYKFDILNNTTSKLFSSREFAIRNPISNYQSSKIYFLANLLGSDDLYENIWMIDKDGAPKDSAIQLTDSRLNKDWLQIENK